MLAFPAVCMPNSHRIQCWNNSFFDRTSLHSLGYTCHLGHGGNPCPADFPRQQLTIVDVNGWHKVQVGFCKCGASDVSHEHYRQLLRMRWYPASFSRPKTAFTFDLLETYHKVTLQGKLNLYDFYHAIMHKTDNQGRSKPLVSGLKAFITIHTDRFPTVSLSRDLPLYASVETSQGRQTRGRCSPNTSPFRNNTWILCGRVSRLSTP